MLQSLQRILLREKRTTFITSNRIQEEEIIMFNETLKLSNDVIVPQLALGT